MPLRVYRAVNPQVGCAHCAAGFEELEAMHASPCASCPACGSPVQRVFTAPRVLGSNSSQDERAKAAGFHKLKRLGSGEYEKQY